MTLDTTTFEGLLNTTLTIRRPSYTSDGAGGASETTTQIGTVAARLRPLTPREEELAGRMQTDFDHIAYVLAPTSAQRGDYLERSDGYRYRVIELVEPSYAGHHVAIRCKRERTS